MAAGAGAAGGGAAAAGGAGGVPAAPPPPPVVPAAAAIDPVIELLVAVNIPRATAPHFQEFHGLGDISKFRLFRESDVDDMIKNYNSTRPNRAGPANRKLGSVVTIQLKALVFWITGLYARNKNPDYADWDDDLMHETIENMCAAEEAKLEGSSNDKLVKIDMGVGYEDWKTGFIQELETRPSAQGHGWLMVYMAREEKPAGYNPANDPNLSPSEVVNYQIQMTGPAFRRDDSAFFGIIQTVTIGTPIYPWIQHWEGGRFGRLAWLEVDRQMEGTDQVRRRLVMAQKTVSMTSDGVYYCSEQAFPFAKYAAKLQQAYATMAKYDNPTGDPLRVRRLVDGIQVQNSLPVTMAKTKVIDDFYNDWPGSVAYLATKVAETFGASDGRSPRNKFKNRCVSEARGGGGRGGGRGRGGRGRGGKGGRGGGGNSNKGFRFNGVDCSDYTRNFSKEEMSQMGGEGREYVKAKRRQNNISKYGNNYRKRNVQQLTTDQEGGEEQQQQAEPADVASASGQGKSEKGAQNGLAFGAKSKKWQRI